MAWCPLQEKLHGRPQVPHAPRDPALYLAGLVYCAGCGRPMVARTDHCEYYCGTWERHRKHGTLANSPCQRNGVRQAVLEGLLDKYLEETGQRLEVLEEGMRAAGAGHLTDRLGADHTAAERRLYERVGRLYDYLWKNDPRGLAALERDDVHHNEYEAAPGDPEGLLPDFARDMLALFRWRFDPEAATAKLTPLRAEYDRLVLAWADLPTPKAKEAAKARLVALEAKMAELERQREDAAQAVADACREVHGLQLAVADAQKALAAEADEQALRRRAEAVRRALGGGRIVVEFKATGRVKTGYGYPRSAPTCVHFLPGDGGGKVYEVAPGASAGGTPADGGFHSSGLPSPPALGAAFQRLPLFRT
jgi:hypothetical protein